MAPALLKQCTRGAAILIFVTLILIVTTQSCIAFSPADFHAAIVSNVFGYGHYIPRNPLIFKPGETMKVYLAVDNVNINRAAAVDFVVIIKDPKGYVVYGKVTSLSTLSYKDKLYTVLDVDIPEDWICGKYTLDAYAFDVLDTLPTQLSYNDLYYKILYSGETSPSISTIPRKEAPYAKKELTFYVSNSVPEKFYLFNEKLEAKTLPVNVSNTVTVSILNPRDVEGKTTVRVLVDGKVVDSVSVSVPPRDVKTVSLKIPPLKGGEHVIKVVADHTTYLLNLPIVVSPLVYDDSVTAGRVKNGTIIYSPNDYVLGSAGITSESNVSLSEALANLNETTLNREDAVKMITNMLAYAYRVEGYKGVVNIALLKGSDERAEKILPILLEIVKEESHAPIRYVGVRDALHLKDVDILFYVNSSPNFNPSFLIPFFEKNGTLICDNPDYWTTYRDELAVMFYNYGWNYTDASGIYDSYYNLRLDKGLVVRISVATELPTKFEFLSLEVRGPPGSGMPPLVNVSTPINVTFKVRNLGKSGSELIKVLVNGETAFSKDIFLKTGQSETITFQYIPSKPGSYRVTIPGSDLMQVFFVKSPSSGQVGVEKLKIKKTPEHRAGAAIVAISAGVLAVLIVLRIFMRD